MRCLIRASACNKRRHTQAGMNADLACIDPAEFDILQIKCKSWEQRTKECETILTLNVLQVAAPVTAWVLGKREERSGMKRTGS